MTFVDVGLTNAFRKLVVQPVRMPQLVRVVDVPFVLGTTGVPLAGGEHVFVRLGLNGPATVLTWSMAITVAAISAAGSVTVDVRSGPTMASVSSICGAATPRLTAQAELVDQVPTGWSTSLPDPSWLEAVVTAVDGTAEVVGLTLRMAVGVDPTYNIVTDNLGNPLTDASGDLVTVG